MAVKLFSFLALDAHSCGTRVGKKTYSRTRDLSTVLYPGHAYHRVLALSSAASLDRRYRSSVGHMSSSVVLLSGREGGLPLSTRMAVS